MKLDWRIVRGSQEEQPAAIDTTSSADVVYIRKDIERINVPGMDGQTVEMWQYNEAVLTVAEYDEFNMVKEAVAIAQGEKTDSTENQAAIMEAQASTFEQLLIMQENQAAIMEAQAALYEGGVTV